MKREASDGVHSDRPIGYNQGGIGLSFGNLRFDLFENRLNPAPGTLRTPPIHWAGRRRRWMRQGTVLLTKVILLQYSKCTHRHLYQFYIFDRKLRVPLWREISLRICGRAVVWNPRRLLTTLCQNDISHSTVSTKWRADHAFIRLENILSHSQSIKTQWNWNEKGYYTFTTTPLGAGSGMSTCCILSGAPGDFIETRCMVAIKLGRSIRNLILILLKFRLRWLYWTGKNI